MKTILAIYGSPRRNGNTKVLLDRAVRGALEAGADVDKVVLRDQKMSPCLEIYACKKDGRCVIRDDFQRVYDQLLACQGLILASPIFFGGVTAQVKILMDRCQSLWVKKYWIDKVRYGEREATRKGLFVSVGATRGENLFDGALYSVKYFFDVLDMELWRSVLYRGLDTEGAILNHPEYLEEAYNAGRDLAAALPES